MAQYIIKDFKVDALPAIGVPNSRYYVLNGQGTDIDEYITDLNGFFHKVNPIIVTPAGSFLKSNVTLGENIGSGFVIHLVGGTAFKYNQNNLSLYDSVVGITNQAGNIGDLVEIITSGSCNQLGGLTPGLQYYASNTGLVTSSIPSTGIIQPLGVAISATSILVNIQKPYIKI